MSDQRHVRRILYKGDTQASDLRAAHAEVEAIRSELANLRHRLSAVARDETYFWFDSVANDAAGALSCAISSLYGLVQGERSLDKRADSLLELWADAEAHPEFYVIREGKSQ